MPRVSVDLSRYNILPNHQLSNEGLEEKFNAMVNWCRQSKENVVIVERLLKGQISQQGMASVVKTYFHIEWLERTSNESFIPAQTQVEFINDEGKVNIPDDNWVDYPCSFFSCALWNCGFYSLPHELEQAHNEQQNEMPAYSKLNNLLENVPLSTNEAFLEKSESKPTSAHEKIQGMRESASHLLLHEWLIKEKVVKKESENVSTNLHRQSSARNSLEASFHFQTTFQNTDNSSQPRRKSSFSSHRGIFCFGSHSSGNLQRSFKKETNEELPEIIVFKGGGGRQRIAPAIEEKMERALELTLGNPQATEPDETKISSEHKSAYMTSSLERTRSLSQPAWQEKNKMGMDKPERIGVRDQIVIGKGACSMPSQERADWPLVEREQQHSVFSCQLSPEILNGSFLWEIQASGNKDQRWFQLKPQQEKSDEIVYTCSGKISLYWPLTLLSYAPAETDSHSKKDERNLLLSDVLEVKRGHQSEILKQAVDNEMPPAIPPSEVCLSLVCKENVCLDLAAKNQLEADLWYDSLSALLKALQVNEDNSECDSQMDISRSEASRLDEEPSVSESRSSPVAPMTEKTGLARNDARKFARSASQKKKKNRLSIFSLPNNWFVHVAQPSRLKTAQSLDMEAVAVLKIRAHRARANNKAKHTFIINPHSPFKLCYDMFVGLLVCYSLVTVPVTLSFGGMDSLGFKAFETGLDVVFMIDLLLSFFTAYEEGGQLVYDRKAIANCYLRTNFFLDLLGSIPFYILTEALITSSSLILFKFLRFFRLLRILRLSLVYKLARLSRLKHRVKSAGSVPLGQSDSIAANLVSRSIAILYVAHLMACAWHSLNSCDREPDNWVRCGNPNNFASAYLASFYFTIQTMMTVGYGDVNVNTDAQRAFSMVIQLTGPLIVGVIVSSIGELVESFDLHAKYLAERMSSIKEYMFEKKFPGHLDKKLYEHFAYFYSHTTVFQEEAIVQTLPPQVHSMLIFHQHQKHLENIIFLKNCFRYESYKSKDCILTMLQFLKPMFAKAGEVVAVQGDPAEDVYFIKKGRLNAILMENDSKHILIGVYHQGSTVNMTNVVSNLDMECTLKAACPSDLLWIHMEDLKTLMDKNPELNTTIKAMVEKEKENWKTVLQSNTIIVGGHHSKEMMFCEPSEGRAQVVRCSKSVQLDEVKGLFVHSEKRTVRTIRISKNIPFWAYTFDIFIKKKISADNSSKDKDVIEKDETSESLWKQWLIDPHCPWQKKWDIFVLLLTLYSVITIPYSIGFNVQSLVLTCLDATVDFFYLLDVVMKFRTLHEYAPDLYFAEPVLIAISYARSWLFVDALSSLPIDTIFSVATSHKSNKGSFLRLVRIFRFLRFLKMMRLLKLSKLSKSISPKVGAYKYIINQLILLFGSLLYVGHFFGCFWAYLAYENEYGLEASWMAGLAAGDVDLPDSDNINQYTASVYWAFTTITTVGYGDIKPTTDHEKVYSVFVMLIGAALFSFIVGNVSNLAYRLSVMKQLHKTKRSEINEYIKEQRFGFKLSKSIKKHVQFAFSINMAQLESGLLRFIPCELRKDALLYSYHEVIQLIPVLCSAPRSFTSILLQNMTLQFTEATSFIYAPGEQSKGLYFLIGGSVEEITKCKDAIGKAQLIGIVEKGGYFGHRRVGKGAKEVFGAKALTDCQMLVLDFSKIEKMQLCFPSVAMYLKTCLQNNFSFKTTTSNKHIDCKKRFSLQ